MPSEAGVLAREAIDIGFELNGVPASYVPPGGGTPLPCLVIRDSRDIDADAGDGRPPSGQDAIQVRASEVAAPKSRGTFTLSLQDGGTSYTIVNRPLLTDPNGFVWKMWIE